MPTARRLMISGEEEDCFPNESLHSTKLDPNSGWWTIPGKKCAGAYQAKGASSYIVSKVDLTGRGHNLVLATKGSVFTPTVDCGWSVADGFMFRRLTIFSTGIIIPDSPAFSAFVVFMPVPDIAGSTSYPNSLILGGSGIHGFSYGITRGNSWTVCVQNTPSKRLVPSIKSVTAIGISGLLGFSNGVVKARTLVSLPYSNVEVPLLLGGDGLKVPVPDCIARAGTGTAQMNLHSVAFYYDQITEVEGVALQTRMMAL